MHCHFSRLIFALNSTLLFLNLLIFDFLLDISEFLICSISALRVRIILPLDAFHLIMLFAGTLMHLKPFSLYVLLNYQLY
jgi:hypothetical protein